jgi:hypothetical protein
MRTFIQQIIEVAQWPLRIVQAWVQFGILLYILAIALPIAAALFLVVCSLPLHFVVTALMSDWLVMFYMLLVFVVTAFIVLHNYYRDDPVVRRGRQIRTEHEAVAQSAVRPVSRMNRSRP